MSNAIMNENRLYVFDEIETLDEEYLRLSIPYLSPERRDKAFSYHFPLDRKLSVTAYLLLRIALREIHGIDEPVVFSYSKDGKPRLRDYPQIHFNLSHCRSAVACVLSVDEVGVDVQEIIPISDSLAKKTLTSKEYAEFKVSPTPFELFCKYWTIKESHLKRTGQGIGTDLTELSALDVAGKTIFKNNKNYCCCVAGITGLFERVNISSVFYNQCR